MSIKKEILPMRTVCVKGSTYVRKEDIVEMLRHVGGSEVTDVRNRLEELARNVEEQIK